MAYEVQSKSLIKAFDRVGRVFFRSELSFEKMLDDSDSWEYTYMDRVNSIIEVVSEVKYSNTWDCSKYLEARKS